ncbi:MAG: cadherin domain-containing protein, partial [Sedimenticola sp.]
DFDLSVTATSTESEGGAQVSVSQSVAVEIIEGGSSVPSDIEFSGTSVEENATGGTVVATLHSIDQDTGETFSYELVRDASGHFEIINDQLIVKEGADIDYESQGIHELAIKVTDSDGNVYTESINIHVADVQEAVTTTEVGGTGSDNITGSQSDDVINGMAGNDNIRGNHGNDTLLGGEGDDTIDGNKGNDILDGGSGNDTLRGGKNDDILTGGEGDDNLDGGKSDDRLYGGIGDDELSGSDGNDVLHAGSGNDNMTGGKGDDTFIAGEGNDQAEGGEGSDTYTAEVFDGSDYFSGGDGGGWTDVIQLNAEAAPGNDPNNPWTISVDGEQVEYELADHALSLNPDASGVISFADGSELGFDGVERIEW